MIETQAGQRAMKIAFWIALAGFLVTCAQMTLGAKDLGEELFRLALPTGIMFLASAIVFTKPNSRAWLALIFASSILCAAVLWHGVARFLR